MKTDEKAKKVKCPECGRSVRWQGNRFRPFCSNRCKQIDLGKWLREEYSLPVHDISGTENTEVSEQEMVH